MKWFRSNIRIGSRLALLALAIQFLLSFGHFHSGSAWAASMDAKPSGLHDTIGFAATHQDASDGISQATVSGPARLKTSGGHVPSGPPTDDCAVCAVMALANAMVNAAPQYLLAPQAAELRYSASDAEFTYLNSARVAFQPRAPPIS